MRAIARTRTRTTPYNCQSKLTKHIKKMNRLFKSIATVALCAMAVGCSANDPIEKRIDSLLSEMTLEEKIGQLNQVTHFHGESLFNEVAAGNIGSILNIADPAEINRIQRAAVEQSRLGIPLVFARDVIHGFHTIFPIPLGQAASFDPAIVEQGARVAAEEAVAAGIRWTFSPMVDISRDNRWGRIAESFGEDPYLTTELALAMLRGYQENEKPLAACAKHYVGYGASEGGLDYAPIHITERELRNYYLPPFEALAKAGCMTLMPSFNDNDGIPSAGNKFLLRDVLRGEWGWDGCVVSDWGSVGGMINHGFAADLKEATKRGLTAGTDVDMMSFAYISHIKELVESGELSEKVVDESVRNILRLKFRLGLFENPYVEEEKYATSIYTPESLEAARVAAVESAVLLKNDKQTLPLNPAKTKRILVAGPLAKAPHDQLGTWVFDGQKEHTVTPLQALMENYGDRVKVGYSDILSFSREKCSERELRNFTSQAASYDAVVLFIGEESILSGEAHSLVNLDLQGSQSDLLEAARRSGKPVVAVVMAGRALTVGKDLENIDALLWSFHPGTMGGPALAQLLFGEEVPSGKLPITFPVAAGQEPIYYNAHFPERPASGNEVLLNDIPLEAGQTSLGCSAYWLDGGFGPLYPFGYGLSYTTFEYSNIRTDKSTYGKQEIIKVSFTLSNTGKYDATEVVQLYVRDIAGSTARPKKELKAFERVSLKAGESREMTIELPVERLAFWNIDMEKVVEAGEFHLWLAGDSASGEILVVAVK